MTLLFSISKQKLRIDKTPRICFHKSKWMGNPINIPSPEHRRRRAGLFSRFAILTLAALAVALLPRNAHADRETRVISVSGNLNFGNVLIYSSAERTMKISNLGNSPLTVFGIDGPIQPVLLWGGYSTDWNWSGTIRPGGSVDLTVTFAPKGAGVGNAPAPAYYPGSLTVLSDATSGTDSIQVSGAGVLQLNLPSPIVSVATNLDFGRTEIGSIKRLALVIANTGNADLTIRQIVFPPRFGTIGFTSGVIPAGGRTNILLAFTPTNVMHYEGTVSILSDTLSGINDLTISGEGVYPTGHYVGLFSPDIGVFPVGTNATFENSGYFSVDMAVNGGFSGVLLLAGVRQPFSGRLSPTGAFTGSIAQEGGSGLAATFRTALGAWVGVISNDTWSANLLAYRAFHPKAPRPSALLPPGNYQFHIAGSTNSLLAPTNDGVGTLRMAASGSAHLSGILGDGAAFSQDTLLCAGTQLPFFAFLYQNRGAVQGWITCEVLQTNLPLAPDVVAFSGTNRISGSINWFKPPEVGTNYPDGFSIQTTVNGPTE